MKIAIAIFVKTPGVSPLKTRLAATTGQAKAETFYKLSLRCIIETLKKLEITPYWAVAEKECLDNPLWNDFTALHTGEGGLGDRQSYIYHELLKTHDGVILIGGDAPQLSADILEQAIEGLKSTDYVIGPANDGGYYLMAGRQAIASKVWAETPWSHEKTRETLISQLESEPIELVNLSDVDTEADLVQILEEMPKQLTASQQRLIQWINQL